ncbi:MAG: replication initiator protein [Wigfec virus K19_179]|nr:MAG: replication initiator protein [Wigfec virus K19_179]
MSCLFPFKRYRLLDGSIADSERGLLSEKNPPINTFYTPCGQCGECRLSRARSWATRCVHEATFWKESCFITLTYKETPPGNSLDPDDTRNFIRRFRDQFKKPFKYFLVGEYGDNFDRPHYHALIFGTDFGYTNHHKNKSSDLELLHDTNALSCPQLNDIWGLGFTSVGELTFDSAAYCAQYAMKKINGPKAKAHYGTRHPEFMRTSQNAIGKQYALRFATEIINNNSVISNSQKQPIPPYYLKQYEKQNLDLTDLKISREEFSETHSIQKSYTRACLLDSKFKLKKSKSDAFRIRYAKDAYFNS